MGLDPGIIAYIIAFGFVAAAIIWSLVFKLAQSLPGPKAMDKLHIVLAAMPVIAFVGPYWVARESIRRALTRQFSVPAAGLGIVISVIWSFCAGVFVIEFLHLIEVV